MQVYQQEQKGEGKKNKRLNTQMQVWIWSYKQPRQRGKDYTCASIPTYYGSYIRNSLYRTCSYQIIGIILCTQIIIIIIYITSITLDEIFVYKWHGY